MIWSLLACAPTTSSPTGPDTEAPTQPSPSSETGAPPAPSDTAPAPDSAGDTAAPPTVDCAALPAGPVPYTTVAVSTQEDFDFDAEGRLVYLDGATMSSALLGTDTAGTTDVIAVSVPDTRGISVLEDGLVAIAYFADGRIVAIDPATGGSRNLRTGANGPNALEVDDADTLFFTEYQTVSRLDLSTGEATRVAQGFVFPNGLSLDEAHDTLYVADNTVGVYRLERAADDTWGAPTLVIEAGPYAQAFDALEVDACGNLYVLGFDNGALYRFDPVTFTPTLLVDFPQPSGAGWTAIHWGSGRGGWRRDVLYVTNRAEVFGAEVGVSGRAQPVDLAP